MLVVLAPTQSFASNDKDSRGNKNNEKHQVSVKANQKSNVFGKFLSAWFGARVYAAPQADRGPSISGITSPTVLKVGEEGTWKVNASDPNNGNLSYFVDWGDESSINPLAKMANPAFVQTSTFTHAYAKEGKYTVKFIVSSENGKQSKSSVTVHVTGNATNLPVISDFSAVSKNPRNATITWKTDIRSSSMVWYSTTTPVVTTGDPQISRNANARKLGHKIVLTKLLPDTTYYVVVGSANKNGKTLSGELSFKTPAQKSDSPVITSLSGASTIVAGQTETVTVNAYDPKNGSLTYSVDWGDTMSLKALSVAQPVFIQSATFEHVYMNAGEYTATFTAQNSAGQKASKSMKIVVTAVADSTGPVISNIATKVSISGSTITWTTDEATKSEIYYAAITPVDVNSNATAKVSDSNMTKEHSLNISGLASGALYHFVIKSTDGSNNSSLSAEGSFTTSI